MLVTDKRKLQSQSRWPREQHLPDQIAFISNARKRPGESDPNQDNRTFFAGFRMTLDILSDDLDEFLPFYRSSRGAKFPRLQFQIVNERHGFEDPINVAQALDRSMGFVRIQPVGLLVNYRACFQKNLSRLSNIFWVLLNLRWCGYNKPTTALDTIWLCSWIAKPLRKGNSFTAKKSRYPTKFRRFLSDSLLERGASSKIR
jgi:hypothetical protein